MLGANLGSLLYGDVSVMLLLVRRQNDTMIRIKDDARHFGANYITYSNLRQIRTLRQDQSCLGQRLDDIVLFRHQNWLQDIPSILGRETPFRQCEIGLAPPRCLDVNLASVVFLQEYIDVTDNTRQQLIID